MSFISAHKNHCKPIKYSKYIIMSSSSYRNGRRKHLTTIKVYIQDKWRNPNLKRLHTYFTNPKSIPSLLPRIWKYHQITMIFLTFRFFIYKMTFFCIFILRQVKGHLHTVILGSFKRASRVVYTSKRRRKIFVFNSKKIAPQKCSHKY